VNKTKRKYSFTRIKFNVSRTITVLIHGICETECRIDYLCKQETSTGITGTGARDASQTLLHPGIFEKTSQIKKDENIQNINTEN
jgi:hypothetical protein